MSDAAKTARIRELNDQVRCKAIGGRIVITRGIQALGDDGVREVLTAVARFDDFSEDNDPWGEHDCAVLTVNGRRIIFKTRLRHAAAELAGHRRDPRQAAGRLVGQKKAVAIAVRNVSGRRRWSKMNERLTGCVQR